MTTSERLFRFVLPGTQLTVLSCFQAGAGPGIGGKRMSETIAAREEAMQDRQAIDRDRAVDPG